MARRGRVAPEIGEVGTQQDLACWGLPLRGKDSRIAHTWHFFQHERMMSSAASLVISLSVSREESQTKKKKKCFL